jgi:tRNA(Ile)-lysidine synthase
VASTAKSNPSGDGIASVAPELRTPATLALAGRCDFPVAGTAVTCAVSGGADSMTLMVLALAAGCQVTAVHVDHGLRPGSADEAAIVERAAQRFGAAFRSVRVEIEPGPNLEARARAARYAALPSGVLTGHTADDQAETVLINLLRGAAGPGLSGMRPDARRPLLRIRRTTTIGFCRSLGIDVVTDPSNDDPAFLRNRVRHELLPLLNRMADRDLVPILTRQSDVLRDDGDLLDELAATIDPTDAKALVRAPVPLARRAVRRWIGGDHPPDAATVERVMEVARGHVTGCEIGGGRRVERSRQRLTLVQGTGAPPSQ